MFDRVPQIGFSILLVYNYVLASVSLQAYTQARRVETCSCGVVGSGLELSLRVECWASTKGDFKNSIVTDHDFRSGPALPVSIL